MKMIRELVVSDFVCVMLWSQCLRVVSGHIVSGDDIVVLERFVGLTIVQFAKAFGVSLVILCSWKRGESRSECFVLMFLCIAVWHPCVL